ncbi:Predicted acetyltransferase [Geosporobacter subterraneus DSM 17957]|uniref:Predicted acetyltransferase n=1 Tax=Geosporobacter subterraneus DSM 17957 TaxID=1121919 RepID=A0A1M6DK63_9FIRM|nr:GNAT family N-acetyltransferase [Geosporobacter subterraneus]SHI73531.1 Predicted acetyltransferase [Geosporobacter subterraneus DSM 17957]
MNIRLLDKNHIPTAKELWGYAFEKNEPFYSWYFDEVFKPENSIGVFFENQLVSCLQLNPYRLKLKGSSFSASYVVGVITAPEFRNRGFMKPLLEASLQEMRRRNHSLSILMPFDTTYYQPYGWELCYTQLRYEVPPDSLRKISQPGGLFSMVSLEKDISSMDAVYRQWLTSYQGYIARSHRDWLNLLKDLYCDGGYARLLRDDQHQPVGYVLYYLEKHRLFAKEIAYTTAWAQRAIFDFLYRHKAQVDQVGWTAPMGDPTYLYLPDRITPKAVNSVKVLPFMAGRVVDVKMALENLSFESSVSGEFSLAVQDLTAPWNHGKFLVTVEKGTAQVASYSGENIDLYCSINAFSQLFWGAIDMDQAIRLELIRIQPEKLNLLAQIFPKHQNYINEFF